MSASVSRLADLTSKEMHRRLARGALYLDFGSAQIGVSSTLTPLASDLQALYGAYPVLDRRPEFLDVRVEVCRSGGLRRFIRPQSRFLVEGVQPFDPFPLDNALPLFEWGVNWCFARRCNQYVLLHSGVLALDDRAVIMAAPPGSGKSTLSAAMMLSGFRLLSDEFGVLRLEDRQLLPMLKPVALKNESIDVVRSFSPAARVGRRYTGTRKGDVAHLAPDIASADALARPAHPALIIYPAWRAGEALRCEQLAPEMAFGELAFNSFNYATLGEPAFAAVADVIEGCPAYSLTYSDLGEAISAIRELLAGERAR